MLCCIITGLYTHALESGLAQAHSNRLETNLNRAKLHAGKIVTRSWEFILNEQVGTIHHP